MANKATADTVRADMAPPNFRGAVQQIRTTKAKKDRISGINGEIAQVYVKVEGFKVNRKAAKVFYALDNMEQDERMDFMRSLNGLCDASGWDETGEDLVDQAEGNVVPLRIGGADVGGVGSDEDLVDEALSDGQPKGDDIDEALAGDDFVETSEEELAGQKGRAETKAKARARQKLDEPAAGTGAAAMKAMRNTEPFTGDNSDLANPQGNA